MENNKQNFMEEAFELISQIKEVEPNSNLYTKTLNKIQNRKQISTIWILAAASLIIGLFSAEIYVSVKTEKSSKNEISYSIYKSNNDLYND